MKLNVVKITSVAFLGTLLVLPVCAATLTMMANGVEKSTCSYTSIVPDSIGNLRVNCSASTVEVSPSPAQVPHCSLASSHPSIKKGAAASLMVSCSPAATSYIWTNAGEATTTSANIVVSPAITTTYSVVGVNAAGLGNAATLTLAVNSPVPISAVPNNCRIVDVTWDSGLDIRSGSPTQTPMQSLPHGQMIAFRRTVPGNSPLVRSGTAYANVSKYMSISTNPCDFSAPLATNYCMKGARTNDPVIWNTGRNESGFCHLPPAGTVIYYNIKNATSPTGSDTCPAGADCKFYFYW